LLIDGGAAAVDSLSKFHNSLYIYGWVDVPGDRLAGIKLEDPQELHAISSINFDHPGVGRQTGFSYQSIRSTSSIDLSTLLIFETQSGRRIKVSLEQLSHDRLVASTSYALYRRFQEELARRGAKTLLDVGGRDRSKVDYTQYFPNLACTVIDIHPGQNVDVVGDAHHMSDVLRHESFDAVMSVSVFEHLAMPWKAVLEMNHVMRRGALGMIHTHQTIGMHELPWDFFRFSSSTWDALLNERTGFRVIDRAMDLPQYVLPFIMREGKQDAEKAAGYEASTVLFEKTGEPHVRWDVRMADIITTSYPAPE
jgi:hypothetical protein